MAIEGHPATARRLRPSALCTALSVALLAAVPGAQAATINYSLGGYAEYSDNIALTESDPNEETTLGGTLDFDVNQVGRNTTLTARGGIEYLYYTGDLYDDDVRTGLAGQFAWTTWQDRLKLIVEDYASYEPIDVLQSNAPDNQQQVNVFVTGADLNIRPGSVTGGEVKVRYNNYYAEKTDDFDGDRYSASASLVQRPGPTTRLRLTVEGSQVDYDDQELNANYRRKDIYGSYNRTLANIDVELIVGYSWVELTSFDGAEDSSPLFRLVGNWRPTARSTLNAGLYYQFSDAALDLVSRADTIGGPPIGDQADDLTVTPDVYQQRRLQLGYHFTGERFDFDVLPYYENNDYVDPTVESEGSYGIGLGMTYRFQPTLYTTLQLSRSYRSFDAFERDDDDFAMYLAVTKLLTGNWSISFDLRHQERDSNLAEASYDENAAIFSVRYTR
ncbi:outer membrane beta-barrel protein [Lysobacter sp. GCM10012299]|uniref:outer membrane beta-barrel protein n=1 Tax=Lysobacter sp. GCM10012299 TaxID=3317333 RepID=UPI00360EF0F7